MRYYLLTIFFLLNLIIYSQNSGDYPLDIPIILSGTFAELRPNHFHAGIDIKTKGSEGFKVYSIGNGYVSRIQITHGGYGKAVYIKHDNGQSSVYAHLKKYSPKIEKIVKDIQYSNESYTLRVYPKENEIRISEKELIGYSGNTGRSYGPHLHYELRDDKDRPINPLEYKNYTILDTIPPVVLGLYYKEIPENSISGSNSSFKNLKITKISNKLFISDTLYTSGLIGFGVNSYDRMNNTWNKMGLSDIKVNLDGEEAFNMNLNSFSYDEWRHINTFIDYASYKNKKIRIQKLYIEDYNPLNMYNRSLGNGVININHQDKVYLYAIRLFDYNKNFTEILVPILWKEKTNYKTSGLKSDNIYSINKDSVYDLLFDSSSIKLSNNTFYTDKEIEIIERDNILSIDEDSIPVLKEITIKFNTDRYNDSLVNKTYIAKLDKEDKSSFVSNNLKNGKLTADIKLLGDYMIKVDSIPPTVNLIDVENNQWISNRDKLQIKINDKSSGIRSYRGVLNDKWILLEYNPMKGILTYDFNDNINNSEPKNILKVNVTDNVGNTKYLEKVFFRKVKK
tara:strand:+ start:750 stop:2444 length:1695 start_codon:yes stop_codon:yes gene_type:complete